MKRLILVTLLLTTGLSFGQQNTIPISGNVGLGTMNPSAKLDVNGKAIIDSTLIVKDSVLFKNCLHVEQELRVDGKITMMENSVAKENLKVQGTLKLPNLNSPNNISNTEFLLTKGNGAVVKSNFAEVIGELYLVKACSQTYLDNPYWMNGPNKLFTRCPEMKVGIGTNTPDFALDVRGTGYFEGYAALVNARPWIRFTTVENGTDRTAFLIKKNGNVFCTALRVR